MRQVSQNTSASYPPASPQLPSASAYFERGISVVRALRDDALGIGELGGGLPERGSGERDEKRPHGRVVADRADELTHDPGASVDPYRSFGRRARRRRALASRVDLPTPFAPTSATRSPLPTRNETSWNSRCPLPGRFHAKPCTSMAPTGRTLRARSPAPADLPRGGGGGRGARCDLAPSPARGGRARGWGGCSPAGCGR